MGDKTRIRDKPIKFRYKGHFSIPDVMDAVREYLDMHKFDRFEPKYKWKGNEAEFRFKGERKYSAYYKFHIQIDCKMFIVRKEEVIENGEKVKKDLGKLEMVFNCEFESDYGKSFKKFPGLQKALDTPGKGVQFGDIEGKVKPFGQELLQGLVEHMKRYFNMEATG